MLDPQRNNGANGGRKALAGVVLLAALGGIALVIATHWHEVASTIVALPPTLLLGALTLQVAVLVLRLEAWQVCLRAAGVTVGRREIYSAGAVAFPLSVVNLQLSAVVRLGALRRIAPQRAPGIKTLLAAELPLYGAEILFGAILLCFAAPVLGIPVWIAPALFAATLGLLAFLRRAGSRGGALAGFAVLGEVRPARRLAAIVGILILAHVARIWILLMATGLAASPFDASAVLVGQGLLSQLPVGLAASSGASLMVFSSSGVGAAAAAGLALAATEITAALCFAAFALPLALPFLARLFRARPEEALARADA